MKKLIVTILLVALLAGAAYAYMKYFYVEKPKDAFLRAASAAMLGDEEGFLDGFTEESRPLMAGLLALSRADDVRTSKRHPYYFLVTENIEDAQIDGDHAWLKCRRMGDQSNAKYDVPLVKVGQTWKIDALQFTGKEHVTSKAK